MSLTDFNEGEQDDEHGIPEDMRQNAVLSEAVDIANKVIRELHGQIDGMLAAYVHHAKNEAANAAAEILTADPRDQIEIFRLQKMAAGYASVMAWIKETLGAGEQALDELNRTDEENRDGEEE